MTQRYERHLAPAHEQSEPFCARTRPRASPFGSAFADQIRSRRICHDFTACCPLAIIRSRSRLRVSTSAGANPAR